MPNRAETSLAPTCLRRVACQSGPRADTSMSLMFSIPDRHVGHVATCDCPNDGLSEFFGQTTSHQGGKCFTVDLRSVSQIGGASFVLCLGSGGLGSCALAFGLDCGQPIALRFFGRRDPVALCLLFGRHPRGLSTFGGLARFPFAPVSGLALPLDGLPRFLCLACRFGFCGLTRRLCGFGGNALLPDALSLDCGQPLPFSFFRTQARQLRSFGLSLHGGGMQRLRSGDLCDQGIGGALRKFLPIPCRIGAETRKSFGKLCRVLRRSVVW